VVRWGRRPGPLGSRCWRTAGGTSALARAGPAFAAQSPVEGAAPVRGPRAALNYHSNNPCGADSMRAMRRFPAGELSSLSTRWRRSSIVADSREITLRSDTVIKEIVEPLRLCVPIPFLIWNRRVAPGALRQDPRYREAARLSRWRSWNATSTPPETAGPILTHVADWNLTPHPRLGVLRGRAARVMPVGA